MMKTSHITHAQNHFSFRLLLFDTSKEVFSHVIEIGALGNKEEADIIVMGPDPHLRHAHAHAHAHTHTYTYTWHCSAITYATHHTHAHTHTHTYTYTYTYTCQRYPPRYFDGKFS